MFLTVFWIRRDFTYLFLHDFFIMGPASLSLFRYCGIDWTHSMMLISLVPIMPKMLFWHPTRLFGAFKVTLGKLSTYYSGSIPTISDELFHSPLCMATSEQLYRWHPTIWMRRNPDSLLKGWSFSAVQRIIHQSVSNSIGDISLGYIAVALVKHVHHGEPSFGVGPVRMLKAAGET